MIFRFLILSDEVDNFVREIKIDSEATFLDLHTLILDTLEYTKDQMSSFFLCDDNWRKKTEITLVDMGSSSEEDTYLMENTCLEELLEDEDQKLLYVFDYLTERAFFMELREIILGQSLDRALCSKSEGMPPPQMVDFEETEIKSPIVDLLGETFYGDSEYDIDELDKEGFDGLGEDQLGEASDQTFQEERF